MNSTTQPRDPAGNPLRVGDRIVYAPGGRAFARGEIRHLVNANSVEIRTDGEGELLVVAPSALFRESAFVVAEPDGIPLRRRENETTRRLRLLHALDQETWPQLGVGAGRLVREIVETPTALDRFIELLAAHGFVVAIPPTPRPPD